jgi:hypothetical protein
LPAGHRALREGGNAHGVGRSHASTIPRRRASPRQCTASHALHPRTTMTEVARRQVFRRTASIPQPPLATGANLATNIARTTTYEKSQKPKQFFALASISRLSWKVQAPQRLPSLPFPSGVHPLKVQPSSIEGNSGRSNVRKPSASLVRGLPLRA